MTPANEAAGALGGAAGPDANLLTPSNTKRGPDRATTIIATLAELFPQCFVAERWRPRRPLKVGIGQDLIALGILTPIEVGRALGHYTRYRRTYQVALPAGGPRFDLNGNVAGEVSTADVANAKASLAAIDGQAAELARAQRDARQAELAAHRATRRPAEKRNGRAPDRKAQPKATHWQPPQPASSGPRLTLDGLREAARARRQQEAAP